MTSDDLLHLQKWFDDYCCSYHSSDAADLRNILLKEYHTHKVRANIVQIGKEERLDDSQLLLAEAIALFHDIGRFEQYRRFKTFKDSESVNHAALGATILLEQKVLDFLPHHDQIDIVQAVRLHNVFTIPAALAPTAVTLLKLIRDADKLDIWRVFIEYYSLPVEEKASAVGLGFPDDPFCSIEVLECLTQQQMVNLSMLKTLNDFKLLQLSWIYDLNFQASFSIVKKRKYIDSLAETLPDTRQVREAISAVCNYMTKLG